MNQKGIFYRTVMVHYLFHQSISASAVIRQNDFLEKFQKHFLYSYDLQEFGELRFQNLVEDYVSFVKLARKGQMIVPTFDIDLIWYTHMRYPSDYHKFSTDLCGFILNHDDSIEQSVLIDAYQTKANRWKQTYQSQYNKNINREHSQTIKYRSSRGKDFTYDSTFQDVSISSCAYTDTSYNIGWDSDGGDGCSGD